MWPKGGPRSIEIALDATGRLRKILASLLGFLKPVLIQSFHGKELLVADALVKGPELRGSDF